MNSCKKVFKRQNLMLFLHVPNIMVILINDSHKLNREKFKLFSCILFTSEDMLRILNLSSD